MTRCHHSHLCHSDTLIIHCTCFGDTYMLCSSLLYYRCQYWWAAPLETGCGCFKSPCSCLDLSTVPTKLPTVVNKLVFSKQQFKNPQLSKGHIFECHVKRFFFSIIKLQLLSISCSKRWGSATSLCTSSCYWIMLCFSLNHGIIESQESLTNNSTGYKYYMMWSLHLISS